MSAIRRIRSVFGDNYVPGSRRAKRTPRVNRPDRPKMIAWAGPAAFYQTRWSERNAWYKARIEYPELLPKMYVIEPTNYYKTLEERLNENKNISSLDIGFSKLKIEASEHKNKSEELEKAARKNELLIDLKQVEDDNISIGQHFNVYSDLFVPGAYFHNVQSFKVSYGSSDARTGNVITVQDMLEAPVVKIESPKDGKGYNSLVMVNLDGNMLEGELTEGGYQQMAHWVIGNVADGSAVSDGDVVVPYLPPTPYHGSGYHRIAFVLFRHQEKLDFSSFTLQSSRFEERLFSTNRFLKTFEEKMTPSSLRFCQAEWDQNVDNILHEQGLKSPRFWYQWNKPVVRKQKEFPLKVRTFDKYLDQYRPPEEVVNSVYREWLEKRVHEGEVKKPQFPDIFYADNRKKLQAWQHRQLIDRNLGKGPYARLYHDFQNPAFQKDQVSST